jgi:uncharacterized protein YPO0396
MPSRLSLLDANATNSDGHDGRLPGCRLQRLEVLNWGTFDSKVWMFELDGHNALLTGDIGSGKSTLVDAVTTLLVPAHRVSYNKAAGADTRERDLRSYVRGFYKSERNETTGASQPVGLRDTRQVSIILGVFANADFGTAVTLAQVFRTRDLHVGQPERFYVVADTDLSIVANFSDFGTELASLKRRLRADGARTYDGFPEYGRDFRRKLGIESEQAMELFHQTVSMKAVDDLNEFVRHHMLEPFDTRTQVEALVSHFDDLTRAHDAVLKARAQLERLAPIVDHLDRYDEEGATLARTDRERAALPFYFADRVKTLLGAELASIAERLIALEDQAAHHAATISAIRSTEVSLEIQIAGAGGDRLAVLDEEVRRYQEERPRREERLNRFNSLLRAVDLEDVLEPEQFSAAQGRAAERGVALSSERAMVQNELKERQFEARELEIELKAVNVELQSLGTRRSNLPSPVLSIREQLCTELELPAEDLPFAGELIQVRADAAEWEGATERVLRGFALSLLVPDRHYDSVARWIDQHHLGTRIVYFRVPATVAASAATLRRDARPVLVDMLELKPDSGFESWLEAELGRRADHVCVEFVKDLRRYNKAVTVSGQIKDRDRHEKDDRHRIDDRRQYVLGWTNEAKIDALGTHASTLQHRCTVLADTVASLEARDREFASQASALDRLSEYRSWEELDWPDLVRRVAELAAERQRITSSSDTLGRLTNELRRVQMQISDEMQRQSVLQQDRGALTGRKEQVDVQLAATERLLADEELALARASFGALDQLAETAHGGTLRHADEVETVRRKVSDALSDEAERVGKRQSNLALQIVKAMNEFRNRYPAETAELDDSLEAAAEYRDFHRRVAEDDLPRFEREFKDYLNQNTIRDIAGFSAQLNKQEKQIRDRVTTINQSLVDIDYNDGRYIRLVPDQTPNTEIREFRDELRSCTDNVIGASDDQYSEKRFLQVKRILDRFKGREGTTEADRSWTRRVTDVRQWFVFSATERWRHDDTEYEHYTDSGGKSGGQKEKLAYTILAASLAYQFKLDWDAPQSKAFRFVVIDEAFGRGSELSTRYALSLFTRLGLQLLIVTPLQKIHVIEPHVSAVGYVDNLKGNYSRLQSLTIEEFRRRSREQLNEHAASSSTGPAA